MKKNSLSLSTLAIALLLLLSACTPKPEEMHVTTSQAEAHPHWTYEGEEGPAYWGDIDVSYATCGTGQSQSPINITSPSEEDLANVALYYQSSELNILNNGHTVQANYDEGSYIEVDGMRYDVLQVHFHSPSEHAVDAKPFDAEFHIVHASADGNLAVVGLLVKVGAENAALAPFIDHLPIDEADVNDTGVKFDLADFLPETQTTFRYNGSLTTPPCSEGVNWIVMTSSIEISADQLAILQSAFEGNNRPVQALNDRILIEDATP